jgi:hypothetical protein
LLLSMKRTGSRTRTVLSATPCAPSDPSTVLLLTAWHSMMTASHSTVVVVTASCSTVIAPIKPPLSTQVPSVTYWDAPAKQSARAMVHA